MRKTARRGRARTLVGTWRLASLEVKTAAGPTTYPWGRDAVGRLTYTANGQMSVHLMKAKRTAFSSEDLEGGTAEEIQAAFDGYHAYFGTYSVDRRGRAIVHHIEGCLFPNWVGRDQRRAVRSSANRLTLTSSPLLVGGREEVYLTVWDRIR